MRQKLYNALVNRVPGIAYRYHKVHDGTHGLTAVLSWVYLLLLNLGYYVLFLRFLGKKPNVEIYETKRLPVRESESALAARNNPGQTVEQFVKELSQFDIISFDIFDTLILRPFDAPTDLFFFLDEAVGILDFHRIRIEMEAAARVEHFKKCGNYEITLRDIWQQVEKEVGVPAERGMELEEQLELTFCYANPFMYEVYQQLRQMGKRIVITTDMYLPTVFLKTLLENCGYTGFERLYVSCAYEKSKAAGDLYELLKQELGAEGPIIHVGDNRKSDVHNAKAHGLVTLYYPNVNKYSLTYRPKDMSALIGGAYRGLVNNHLYAGTTVFSRAYEYGFIYGGLFVLGYCSFVHDYCERKQVDKLLFLARDGDILKQVYEILYPGENTAYVCWARFPAVKLMADYNRYDFFRRFLSHKTGQGKTVRQLLLEAELAPLVDKLKEDRQAPGPETVITSANVKNLKTWLQKNWEDVLRCYRQEEQATREYFETLLKDCKRVAAVDIGWAGSGAVSLSYLIERVWNIPCRVDGLIAGTNTVHNAEPDASEGMLQSGRLSAYLYSEHHNRDLLKKHDLNLDYNIYWELLLSSPNPQFLGYTYSPDGDLELRFGKRDANLEGILEIQRGILDFAHQYRQHFANFPEMFQVSGRDAYAPMLAAASYNERYLKMINAMFHLDISVGATEAAKRETIQ